MYDFAVNPGGRFSVDSIKKNYQTFSDVEMRAIYIKKNHQLSTPNMITAKTGGSAKCQLHTSYYRKSHKIDAFELGIILHITTKVDTVLLKTGPFDTVYKRLQTHL